MVGYRQMQFSCLAIVMWIPTRDDASSAGAAAARGQIGVGKADPIRRQPIDIRRANALISITPEIIPANVIGNEKYKVRLPNGRRKQGNWDKKD